MNVSVMEASGGGDIFELENHSVNRSFQQAAGEGKPLHRGKSATPFIAPHKQKEKRLGSGGGEGRFDQKKQKSSVGDLNVAMERHFKRAGNQALKFLMN